MKQDKLIAHINVGKLEECNIKKEMEVSYLDYAMSVIVSRALPDVRDGLKPVHRRILYAMWTIGLKANARFRKSANVVGEVLGKYHPHGDTAVYDSMVRMAQPFSMRYMLINGQGNFGSMDGDSAAAMRYTEAKLAAISEELLYDIEKNTVNFIPNYDGSQKEPTVLPAKLPNLLLNGTIGIAVGMATNIPPHNLTELCEGIIYLIDNPNCDISDLMKFIKGPDFPTGGIIYNNPDIKQAYATGKGGVVIRAKTDIQEAKNGSFKIIITEVPYQVNKASLLEKIANLVKEKRIEGIRDLRDESNKEGVRVVIDLKKECYPQKVLNKLFKLTPLQSTFYFNMLALVDNIQPRILTLKTILEKYIEHRKEIIIRRTEFELAKAKERAHILEGLKIALDNIDKVINTIKKSKDKEEAKVNLIKRFKLSERQAIAILEMKLQNLANLERLKLEEELKEKKKLIKELENILSSKKKILGIIKKELTEIKEKYGDDRRTKIIARAVGEFSQEDLVPNEPMVAVITKAGYIKRLPPEIFKTQARGGKGIIGLTTKEEDIVDHFFTTTTHTDILFFTSRGRVYKMKGYDIPTSSRTAKGQAIVNFLNLAADEIVASVMPLDDLKEYKYLAMVTALGIIKKVSISDFDNIRSNGLIAIKIKTNDALQWVKATNGKDDIILASSHGQAIRFKEKNIRAMGRTASGVKAIKLKKDDRVVGMDVINSDVKETIFDLAVVMENGYGKRTNLKNYKVQGRGGSGIKTAKITAKTGKIVAGFIINNKSAEEDLIIISANGQVIRLPIKSVNISGRATQGVRLMRFKAKNDKVANVTFI